MELISDNADAVRTTLGNKEGQFQNPFPGCNPWHPITDPVQIKTLGKCMEELGEAIQIISRCMIQGIDECDPQTGVLNRIWLENELSDVLANVALVVELYALNSSRMDQRAVHKMERLRAWHKMA